MATVVEYILNLRDDLSKGLEGANVKAEALETTLKSVGEVIGVLGISMAAFAGFEALKGAHEEWEKMEFSISQVEAGLKSTQNAAGLTFEEIQQSAGETSKHIKASTSEILGMQSVLLTFPSITKETFQGATDIVADMSTRLGQDLKSSAIQVGKALQDPIKGVTALRRVGVNFNETQTEMIKHLAETNHLAEAQTLILKELNLEFGGSAKAAFDADAGAQYEKNLQNIRVDLGNLVDDMEKELMPVALEFLQWVKASVDWLKKDGAALWGLLKAAGTAFVIFKSFTVVPPILLAVENAIVAVATGGFELSASMSLALGPVGLMATAIGGLVYMFNDLATAEKRAADQKLSDLEKATNEESEQLNASVAVYEKTMDSKAAIAKAKTDEILDLHNQWLEMNEKMDRVDESSSAYKQMLSEANILNRKEETAKNFRGLIPAKTAQVGKPGANGTPDKEPKTKATGSKAVTIIVTINGGLIHQNIINTKNIVEGVNKTKERLAAALTSVVNDSQIVAGQ